MHIIAIGILRWNSDTPDAVLLSSAVSVGDVNYFLRQQYKDFNEFGMRTIMRRIGSGVQCIDHEGYNWPCVVDTDGLGAICVCDKEYPMRVAVTMLKDLLAQFKAQFGLKWRSSTTDFSCTFAPVETALASYQDPAAVDRLTRVDKQLAETKDILYQTIDKVLERGEKLEDLVAKSSTLSQQSKQFYKTAKKTNSCCTIA